MCPLGELPPTRGVGSLRLVTGSPRVYRPAIVLGREDRCRSKPGYLFTPSLGSGYSANKLNTLPRRLMSYVTNDIYG